MKLATLFLPFSGKGWGQLQGMDIDIPSLAWKLVIPLSLLPPIFLYFNGTHYGAGFLPEFANKNWQFITTTFFLAELLTFFVMGWLIHSVLEQNKLEITYHDAYLLAGIAPIPMWLSSVGLLFPSALIAAFVVGIGLIASCVIVYIGTRALSHRASIDITSMSATYTIMSASLAAWVLLMLIIWMY
ncbi:MAG: hypothetical protein LAT77_02480 [Aliidiomarina sp.]|uniref:YIP1 family protein n=1 Tax=Aliidiomarina sp. TaxID=1872439 RepID=UPI0025BEE15A|nr:YIP1 family protein [Aliidiomarina sp.]MCH8500758.1 hypothetical protein [Aliidiomarina sp.]